MMVNKLKVGNNSQKKSISHSVVKLDEYTMPNYSSTGVSYVVLDLPESIMITNVYVVIADAMDAGSIQVSSTPNGIDTFTPFFGAVIDLSVLFTAPSTLVPKFFETGTYINIEFSLGLPTTGKSYVVVEYVEVEKTFGELTQVPVRDNLIS